MSTPHAFRATAALHAALAEADAAISAAGRDLRAEHKRALEATDIVLVMGRMASTAIAAKYLIEVTEAAIERLRMQLQTSMLETGSPPIALGNGIIVELVQQPDRLVIEDEARIPRHFYAVPEPKLDRNALKRALKSNIRNAIPGAHLEKQNGQTLRISVKQKDAAP